MTPRASEESSAGSSKASPHAISGRFYELDILRGLAAYAVVIFHYKHFVQIPARPAYDYTALPLTEVLMPLYRHGLYFVELFFTLSGFIFFWLYSCALSERHMSGKTFAIARMARLYPLHIATFAFCAAFMPIYASVYGGPFIYGDNDALHFVLNLFLVQHWLPNATQTFNGPSWSISVEVFLYLCFFVLAFLRRVGWLSTLIVVVISFWLKDYVLHDWKDGARGLPSFFLGGLVWHVVNFLRGKDWQIWVVRAMRLLVPLGWAVAYVWTLMAPQWEGMAPELRDDLSTQTFSYVLIPLTLLYLALRQGRHPQLLGRWLRSERLTRFAWVGDISYSLYLWHFPVQLVFMLGLGWIDWEARRQIFASPLMLLAFLAMTTIVAWLSFTRFEMPARQWLKSLLERHQLRHTRPEA